MSAHFGTEFVPVCAKCERFAIESGWSLVHACASVGIEHGKSTAEVFQDYMTGYHKRGHRKGAVMTDADWG